MTEPTTLKNIAETVADLATKTGDITPLTTIEADGAALFSTPSGRTIVDKTAEIRKAMTYDKPHRRAGTAKLQNLATLIAWANRHKGENSILYANGDTGAASLTCIADYNLAGPPSITPAGEETARHGNHRAVYNFPLAKKWARWMKISGTAISGPEMGAFLEDNILDVIDPPIALTLPGAAGAEATPAEQKLIEIARAFNSKYGSATQLFSMASSFSVYESADFSLQHNSTTGEGKIVVKSEHKDATGAPIEVPKLFLIAIPVFEKGAVYRIPVRFQYRKKGGEVLFILTLHDPEAAYDDAFAEACTEATTETGLTLLQGTPETKTE
jgi:hypothetical protein